MLVVPKLLLILPAMILLSMDSSFAQDGDKTAIAFFENYLKQCPDHEIRCVWFPDGSVRVGMMMKLDLNAYESFTVREVHGWAHQNAETRKLSHSQVETLKGLLKTMPESSQSDERSDLVYVSFQIDGQAEQRSYSRHEIPRDIERIYDIGGGYLVTDETERGGSKRPSVAPESKPEPKPESKGGSH